MSRHFILPTIICALSALASCTYSRSTPEPAASRDYASDAECMAKFLDVDMRTGACWINPAKKGSTIALILSEDADELQQVSSANQTAFAQGIEMLNRIAEAHADRPDVDYMAYLLYGHTYIRKTAGHDTPLELTITSAPGKRRYAHLDIWSGTDMPPADFVAQPTVWACINVAVSGWKPFVTELVLTHTSTSQTHSVIVCGLDPMSHHRLAMHLFNTDSRLYHWHIKAIPHLLLDDSRISIDFTE